MVTLKNLMLSNFIINYQYGFVDLYFSSGSYCRVTFDEYTGNIYKRPKIHPLLQYLIDHKALYIGRLSDGTRIVIHNHINPGYALVATWEEFEETKTALYDDKICTNAPELRVGIALNKVLEYEPYDVENFSCQTFVNLTCTNERKNDDTFRAVGGTILGVGAVIGLIAILGGE